MPEPLHKLAPGTIQIPSGAQSGEPVRVSPDGVAGDPAQVQVTKFQSILSALGLSLDTAASANILGTNEIAWRLRDDPSVLTGLIASNLSGSDPFLTFIEGFSPLGAKTIVELVAYDPIAPHSQARVKCIETSGATAVTKILLAGDGSSDYLMNTLLTTLGDILYASAANTPARLAIGGTGQVLTVAGGLPAWATAPGTKLDYAEVTSNVSVTATTSATANTVVAGNAVTYAAQPVLIQFYTPSANRGTSNITFVLYDGATQLGQLGQIAAGDLQHPVKCEVQLTPTAASHTYTVKAFVDAGTGTVRAGNGASGALYPAYVRVTTV